MNRPASPHGSSFCPGGNAKRTQKKKVWFYIAQYPVRWTAQSALHIPPRADLFIPTPFSASLGSILAMQQLRNDYSLTCPPLSIARYSFIQLSRLRRREVKENAHTFKRYQRGFEPGLSRLRVRHSTAELPRSTQHLILGAGTAIHNVGLLYVDRGCDLRLNRRLHHGHCRLRNLYS